ncbi:MAG: hypothetical protein SGJ20_07910 [Planctomycetota bacterium]|nr:hypothetical protein [Planctomycetota bacterium]
MHSDLALLPFQLQTLVEGEIDQGEKILWVQQPIASRMARNAWPIVLFGIPWTAFALFWTGGALFMGGNPGLGEGLFALFGLPFILIGAGMLSSPYWMARKARGSVYVLTDHRAILFDAGIRGAVTICSFEPVKLNDLRRTQYPDGSGDLIFKQDVRYNNDGERKHSPVGFIAVPDVKRVEELVRALVDMHAE